MARDVPVAAPCPLSHCWTVSIAVYWCVYSIYLSVIYSIYFLSGNLKVMLLCGSDLLESFSTPGVWIPDQV
jgi:hypothetical protein